MLARAFRAYFLLLFVLAVCCQRAAQAGSLRLCFGARPRA